MLMGYETMTHLIGYQIHVRHGWDIDTPGKRLNTYGTCHVACPFNFINFSLDGHVLDIPRTRWDRQVEWLRAMF